MPKPTKGPRLGGSSSHQKALLANLATSLFEHGRIKTTEPKARALRPYAEKLITHAKKGTLHNRREVMKKIRDKDVVHVLFDQIGPFFADRNGGYTRIIKVEARKGDNAPMAVIELVREKTVTSEADRARRRGRRSKKTAPVAAAAAPQAAVEPEAAVGPEETVDEVKAEDAAIEEGQEAEAAEEVAEAECRREGRRRQVADEAVNEPAIDTGGGLVRLRLDIAYDGTEFAGWAAQAGQRTVAGVLDDALSTVFRTKVQLRAAGRTDTGVHAAGQVAHVDVPVDALPHAYPRSTRVGEPEFLPLVRRLAKFVPQDVRVRDIVPRRSGFRCPVLRAAPALRLSPVDRAVRRRTARGTLRHPVAASAGCRGHGGGVARPVGVARLRRVLSSSRRRHHDPRSAAVGLVTRRRRRHRPRHRGRVLLGDGAVVGGRAAGRR